MLRSCGQVGHRQFAWWLPWRVRPVRRGQRRRGEGALGIGRLLVVIGEQHGAPALEHGPGRAERFWQCYRILAQEWSAPLGVDSFKLPF